MKKTLGFLPAAAMLLLFSCHSAENPAPLQDTATGPATGQAGVPDSSRMDAPGHAVIMAQPDFDQKLVKTAQVTVETPDFVHYQQRVYEMVKKYGGYVAAENQTRNSERHEATLTLKVPVPFFESLLGGLADSTHRLISRTVTAEDVSAEVVDIRARMAAKKQMRERYLEFFRQARNMDEVLQVQTALNELQGSLESAAGREAWLRHQSAFSTVELSFYQLLAPVITEPDDPGLLQRIAAAFVAGSSWLANLLVGLVTIWPLILVVLITVWAWRRSLRPRNAG